jgi:hypothetical protein
MDLPVIEECPERTCPSYQPTRTFPTVDADMSVQAADERHRQLMHPAKAAIVVTLRGKYAAGLPWRLPLFCISKLCGRHAPKPTLKGRQEIGNG